MTFVLSSSLPFPQELLNILVYLLGQLIIFFQLYILEVYQILHILLLYGFKFQTSNCVYSSLKMANKTYTYEHIRLVHLILSITYL